jgi:hypothetical protein
VYPFSWKEKVLSFSNFSLVNIMIRQPSKIAHSAVLTLFLITCVTSLQADMSQSASGSEAFKFDQSVISGPKPWTSAEFQNDPNEFQFVIIGDRTGGANAEHTFLLAVD